VVQVQTIPKKHSIFVFNSLRMHEKTQEYYVRHKNGWTLDSESERRRMIQNLMAATERRVSHVRFQNGLTSTSFTVSL